MRFSSLLACVFAVLAALVTSSSAQQVMVSPGTIVFDGRTRGAELLVANTGTRTSTYRLDATYFTMREDGRLTEVKGKHPSDSAAGMLRYSPRQFQLAPGKSQIVRIAARKPASLPPGEYRVHLRVTNLGEVSETPTLSRSDGSFAQINLRVTRAVRVLVRHGVGPGKVNVHNLAAQRTRNGQVQVSFDLQRKGAASSRGVYVLFNRDRRTGRASQRFLQQGVIIYKDLPSRRMSHALPAAGLNGNPEICVAYHDTEGSARRPKFDVRCTEIRG